MKTLTYARRRRHGRHLSGGSDHVEAVAHSQAKSELHRVRKSGVMITTDLRHGFSRLVGHDNAEERERIAHISLQCRR